MFGALNGMASEKAHQKTYEATENLSDAGPGLIAFLLGLLVICYIMSLVVFFALYASGFLKKVDDAYHVFK